MNMDNAGEWWKKEQRQEQEPLSTGSGGVEPQWGKVEGRHVGEITGSACWLIVTVWSWGMGMWKTALAGIESADESGEDIYGGGEAALIGFPAV